MSMCFFLVGGLQITAQMWFRMNWRATVTVSSGVQILHEKGKLMEVGPVLHFVAVRLDVLEGRRD